MCFNVCREVPFTCGKEVPGSSEAARAVCEGGVRGRVVERVSMRGIVAGSSLPMKNFSIGPCMNYPRTYGCYCTSFVGHFAKRARP